MLIESKNGFQLLVDNKLKQDNCTVDGHLIITSNEALVVMYRATFPGIYTISH